MKISFVIPAYNEEAYIGKCINSILEDTKDCSVEYEIIVVNNASKDRTKQVVQQFSQVKLVDEIKKGLTFARQAGYEAATGDIIANVDADNILPPGWTKKVAFEFTKNHKLVALSGPVIFYDLSRFINFQVRLWYVLGYVAYLFNHFIFRTGGMLQGGNFVLRKSALEKIGGYDTGIVFYGEDTDIARRLQKTGYVKFTFWLPIYSSGRRLSKEGILNMGIRYAANYFSVILLKKPLHKEAAELD